MISLAIDGLVPGIVSALRAERNLVIEAAPGAGKTTRVPPALLEFGGVVVLEPRRIAARLAARRVAEEMGERVGETVGYQVRFEDVSGPKTRLRFLTEGVLTRRMQTDPELRGVSVVVLDEFHERHMETDLALALVRRLQNATRPDLRIVVMSATLEAGPVSAYLGDCRVVVSEGRLFPLQIVHLPYSAVPLEEQVAAAVLRAPPTGHVLVFLPGAAEIRRAARACQRLPFDVAPLHGDLSPGEQDRAIAPSAGRKLILATNVAESSITIDGVNCVIDSGLARVARDSPWTGLPMLEVARISKASAKQRAGRAGRTGPGVAIRLYSAEDFQRRAEQDAPEILRREVCQVALQLEAMGIAGLDWLDAPSASTWEAANALLDRLRARGADARRMQELPVHPRVARLLIEAERRGVADAGCRVAALLSAGDRAHSCDLWQALDAEMAPRTQAVYEQLRRRVRGANRSDDDALGMAALAAFPDRVGRIRNGVGLMAGGGSAAIEGLNAEYFVALDMEERSDRPLPVIRLACGIRVDWLLDLFPERVTERNGVEWNRVAEGVEQVSAMLYDQLPIDERRGGTPDPELAGALLAEKAMEAGIERLEDLAELRARLEFAAGHSTIEPLRDEAVRAAVAEVCYGRQSFAALREGAIAEAILRGVDVRLLNEVAPATLRLAGGRQTKVHYDQSKPPWVASRLQDFFGMQETPRIARGAVPLVLHLLAPNQRPVQTTTDLAGFWTRLYPQLRRELGRRYPRHAWPEL